MYILAFDTTAAACSIILQQDDKVLSRFHETMDFGQSEVLIPTISDMLFQNNLRFENLGLLLVCVGPGSFTGVRSSISAARTFPLACPRLALGGVSAFDAYVLGLDESERADINAVIIETKREDFYIQLFDKDLKKLTPPQALAYEDIVPLLRGKKVSLIGDGVERFLSRPSGLSLHSIQMPESLDVELLAKAGIKQYQDKRLDYPKPLYLRAPDVSMPKK